MRNAYIKVLYSERSRKTMKEYLDNIIGVELLTTRACNMRCTYCYEKKDRNSVFSSETAANILEMIRNNPNIKYIDLFGGESLLPEIKNNIMSFLKELKNIRSDISFYITTNALETEKVTDIIDFIKDNFEKVSIQISLDGAKQAQDICRIDIDKNGTFDRVFNNTILLLERYNNYDNVKINLHHVISLQNVQYIIDTVCLDNSLCTAYPKLHISYNSEHSINNKPHDTMFLIEVLEFLHGLYLQNDLKPYVWDQFLHIDDYFQEDHARCNLMDKYITVSPNGDLSPCHFFSNKHNHNFYNINTKQVDNDKYNRSLAFAKHDVTPISELGYSCSNCVAKGFCAYCAANSYIDTNYTNKSIIGSTACSYSRTIGDWVVDKYNDGIRTLRSEEEINKLFEQFESIANRLEKEPTAENLREFLFYRMKCKLNGLYEI